MRRILYLSNRYQALYENRRRIRQVWRHRGLISEADWSHLEAGRVLVLADLIEEEFRLEYIPRVTGSDHRALVARKQRQLFRDEPFVAVTRLGRQTDGRRDDMLLFSAIRDGGNLDNCLQCIDKQKVEVQGIWSLPKLSEYWAKVLPPMSQGLRVLVTAAGDQVMLRQCFCRAGRVIFSRLSIEDKTSLNRDAAQEIERTYRYLIRTLRLPEADAMTVQVLAPSGMAEDFQELAGDLPGFDIRCLNLAEIAPRLGWRGDPDEASVPAIAAAQLGQKRWLASQYRNAWQRSRLRQRRLLMAIYGGAGALLLTASGYGAQAWQHGRELQEKVQLLARQKASLQRLVRELPVPQSVNGFDPWQIETAMTMQRQLSASKVTPKAILVPLSQALSRFPGLTLVSLAWQRRSSQHEDTGLPSEAPVPLQLELQLRVDGGLNMDIQAALAMVEKFNALLAVYPHFSNAVISSSPVPTDRRTSVSGETGSMASARTPAEFNVTASFRQDHEN